MELTQCIRTCVCQLLYPTSNMNDNIHTHTFLLTHFLEALPDLLHLLSADTSRHADTYKIIQQQHLGTVIQSEPLHIIHIMSP